MARSKYLVFCIIAASVLVALWIVPAEGATIIFDEGFEGAFPGSNWQVGDSNPENGLDYWDDVAGFSHTGSWSGWCAGQGTTYFNTSVWMENFEGAFPTADYEVVDGDSGSGIDMWDDTSYRVHGGSWSAWCAAVGNQQVGVSYTDNIYLHKYDTNMWTFFRRWADLSSYSFATLSYWYWVDTEPADYFILA